MRRDPQGTSVRHRGKLGNLKKMKANRTGGDDPLEVVEVELYDALPALALLAKIHGLVDRKAAVDVSDSAVTPAAAARALKALNEPDGDPQQPAGDA
jgi:hypothetical protein